MSVKTTKTQLDRLASYDRAMEASKLIRNSEFYEATEKIARSARSDPESEKEFLALCKNAGITDEKLADHMWTIIKACAYGKGSNYLAENPGPLW